MRGRGPASLVAVLFGFFFFAVLESPLLADNSPRSLFSFSWKVGGADFLPDAVAINPAGTVYVLESFSRNVNCYSPDGSSMDVLDLRDRAVELSRRALSYIAVDHLGNLYVTEEDSRRIRKFNVRGELRAWWQFKGPDREYRIRHGLCGCDSVDFIGGIAADRAGNVYVTDSVAHRVLKFDFRGKLLTRWGREGWGAREFSFPKGVAADSVGRIYVVDRNNHRIKVFTRDGRFLTMWGRKGKGRGEFLWPSGIATDKHRNVYVTDTGNHRIQMFDSHGRFTTQWGSRGSRNGRFLDPMGVAVDSLGNVYVADRGNHRIQKFSPIPQHATSH